MSAVRRSAAGRESADLGLSGGGSVTVLRTNAPCAGFRTIQLRKLRRTSVTASEELRCPSPGCAQSSCGRFSQLPPQTCATMRRDAYNPVADALAGFVLRNFNFWQFSAGFGPLLCCRCVTPILKNGGASREVCVPHQNGNPRLVVSAHQRAPP